MIHNPIERPSPATRRYLSLEEAAEYSTLSIQTLRRAIRRKQLQAFKPARRVLIDPAELDRWVREAAVGGA
jgi:excisionase family DNA binding protein